MKSHINANVTTTSSGGFLVYPLSSRYRRSFILNDVFFNSDYENTFWITDHWEKSVDIYSVKNGKLRDVSALGTQERMNKYAEQIKKMFESVKFE